MFTPRSLARELAKDAGNRLWLTTMAEMRCF